MDGWIHTSAFVRLACVHWPGYVAVAVAVDADVDVDVAVAATAPTKLELPYVSL